MTVVLIVILILVSLLPFKNNYHLLIAKSGSMEPVVKTGSIILTLPQSDYQIDDIVAYRYALGDNPKKLLVTHRIVEILNENNQKLYLTQGDANETYDSNPVTKNQIIGKLVVKIPYLGYPINFLQTKVGAILIIALAAIVIYGEIGKIKKEIKIIIENRCQSSSTNTSHSSSVKSSRRVLTSKSPPSRPFNSARGKPSSKKTSKPKTTKTKNVKNKKTD